MKNRVLRSALAVILVIAMVLTMAACNNTDPVETTAPVVTSAPAATTTPTEAPVVTVTPTEAPAEVVVDTDEAQLNEYGITFPEFDLTYITDGDDDQDKDSMAFGLKVDLDNIYQEAYTFEISAKISAVAIDGSSLSASKYSPAKLDWTNYEEANAGYYDAADIDKWVTDSNETEKYYFEVAAAGVYTVTYTITVEHDKDDTYGYYEPGEVDETYTIVKTYTVEKGELELKTSDDAFKVETSMFFVDASYGDDGAIFDEIVEDDYDVSIDVTSCTGTEVGEYTLAITIKDEDDNVVDPSDIELANYYVTVTEGTRYILSAEDVAKANAVRKMYAADKAVSVTTEYSQETITYYNTLTAGQKVLAAVKSTATNWDKYYADYLVADTAVSSSAITEAEYNMERDYIIDEVEAAIEAYMTASTTAKKDAALTTLAELLLSIDNDEYKYGSDLSYVLGNLVTGIFVEDSAYNNGKTETDDKIAYAYYGVTYADGVDSASNTWTLIPTVDTPSEEGEMYNMYVAFDDYDAIYFISQAKVGAVTAPTSTSAADLEENEAETYASITNISEYDYENTTVVYAVWTEDYSTNEYMVAFKNVEDDETYNVSFGYEMGIEKEYIDANSYYVSDPVVNDEYDGYLFDWIEDYCSSLSAYNKVVTNQAITQSEIDDLTDYIAKMEGEYVDLISYQLSLKVSIGDTKYDVTAFTGTKVSELHSDMLADAEKIVARWDAYIALIEAYGFEDSYVDNADAKEDKAATYYAMRALLGYTLVNNYLASDTIDSMNDTLDFYYVEVVNEIADKIPADVYEVTALTSTSVYDDEFSGYLISSDGTITVDAYTDEDYDSENGGSYYFTYDSENYVVDGSSKYASDGNDIEVTTVYVLEEKTLSNVLFASTDILDSEIEYQTPDLFVENVLASAESMMQIAIAVQAEVDAIKQDLINYLVSTGKYSSLEDLETGYTYTGYNSYSSAGCLEDLNTWLDTYVLSELLDADSDFYSDLSKKGFDTALTNMLEDVTEDAEEQIDALVDALKATLSYTTGVTDNTVTCSMVQELVVEVGSTKITPSTMTAKITEVTGETTQEYYMNDINATGFVTELGGINEATATAITTTGDTITIEYTLTFDGIYTCLGEVTYTDVYTYEA